MGKLTALLRPLAGLRGPTFKVRRYKGMKGKMRGGRRTEGDRREGEKKKERR